MLFNKGDLLNTPAGVIEIYDTWNKRRGGKLLKLYSITYLEYDITETVTAGRLARIIAGDI